MKKQSDIVKCAMTRGKTSKWGDESDELLAPAKRTSLDRKNEGMTQRRKSED